MDLDTEWVRDRTESAPDPLRRRTLEFFADTRGSLIDRLASAGAAALQQACRRDESRAVALDLLAADALITLALLAAAESAPERMQQIARQLRLGAAA